MPVVLPKYLEDLVNELPGDKNAWKYFFAVTQIPRGSNQEGEFFRHKKVLAFLKEAADELGHETYIDTADNLIVRVKATEGLEDKPIVCYQCHMDMVCQKTDDCPINMETDPLQPYSDGKYIRAKGTSLGADNGIGIGSCFALLADKELKHGPLEILVTRDEETGLYGAASLEPGVLKAKYLINVDSEERCQICIGCAGGFTYKVNLKAEREAVEGYAIKKLVINNTCGGHSGVQINLGRCNPVHVMARLLKSTKINYRVVSMECGTAHNAIPRKCEALIAVPKADEAAFVEQVTAEFKNFAHEYRKIEPNATFDVTDAEAPYAPATEECTKKLINFLNIIPFGPMRMSSEVEGLVETSMILAVTKSCEASFDFIGSVRSSSGTQIEMMYRKLQCFCDVVGATLSEKIGQYPAWEPNADNLVTKVLQQAYREETKEEPLIYAIHAGLECGLFLDKYPYMECTSIGPEVHFPHSPDETLLISSVEEFIRVLKRSVELFAN